MVAHATAAHTLGTTEEAVMDEARFDAWTRRRFGLAAGGFAASLLSLAETEDAQTKKNRKKRCKKLGQTCKAKTKTKGRKCCGDLSCDVTDPSNAKTRCCRKLDEPCTDHEDCCGASCCQPSGQCGFPCFSDRALKANFGSVDPADMLQRVRDLPISTWNYTSDDPAVRHIGPMAQDFGALFGVGADDRHIHPLDGQGVALAAIQGLLGELQDVRAANAQLAERVAALERGDRGAR
jgi:hypothetical protein